MHREAVQARGHVVAAGRHVVDFVVAVVELLFFAGLVGRGAEVGELVARHAREAAGGVVQLREVGPDGGAHVQARADQVAEVGGVFGAFVRVDGWAAVALGVGLVEEDAGGAVEGG